MSEGKLFYWKKLCENFKECREADGLLRKVQLFIGHFFGGQLLNKNLEKKAMIS